MTLVLCLVGKTETGVNKLCACYDLICVWLSIASSVSSPEAYLYGRIGGKTIKEIKGNTKLPVKLYF